MSRSTSKYFAVLVILYLSLSAGSAIAASDVMVLMDASSVSDQHNRTVIKSILGRLSKRLDKQSRFGLFTYSDKARENISLEKIDGSILSMLSTTHEDEGLDYRIKNPVAALEKVIYNLRSKGRMGRTKVVLMLGNGEIATGDPIRDQELSSWLLEDLSEEIKQSEIRLFWLAFSEKADFRIIQSVTRKTKGAYYRAFTPEDAVSSIDAIMTALNGAEVSALRGDGAFNDGLTDLFRGTESDILRSMSGMGMVMVVVSFGLVTVMVTGFGIARLRKTKENGKANNTGSREQQNSKAILRDLTGFTVLKEYDITDKKTYIGRLPREVTEHSTVVVIRDSTVGREHASIIQQDGAYWLRDNGTVNGTYLNHQRLNADARLRDGDRIRFARFEFEIALPSEEVTQGVDDVSVDRARQSIRIVEDDDYDDQDKTVYRNQ